jgi:hypothetical protein
MKVKILKCFGVSMYPSCLSWIHIVDKKNKKSRLIASDFIYQIQCLSWIHIADKKNKKRRLIANDFIPYPV